MLKALGLLAVAVIAGLVWWLIRHEEVPEPGGSADSSRPTSSRPAGDFRTAVAPVRDASCTGHAYGKIRGFFARTDCQQLSRALYTTTKEGHKTLVSVAVVEMRTAADAKRLKRLTDTDGTGNVADLVREGKAPMPNAPEVSGGGYASRLAGRYVTIVESQAFDKAAGDELLGRISTNALRLAGQVSGTR
ncbi:MAG: hypothetical protein GEU98_17875 [Pseudonocardiaceae bacterium]|nr:hypothetical protein [Pseudonocardiaceae bacterium]